MSGPKHTPGPWESAWERPDNESTELSELGEEWGIRAADGTIVVGTIYYDGLHLAMNRANANLIAAAPRLAEALKDMIREAEFLLTMLNQERDATGYAHEVETERIEGARAALREAGVTDDA